MPAWDLDLDRYLNRLIPANFVHRLPYPIAHFLGYRNGPPKQMGNLVVAFWALIGAFAGVISLEAMFMIPEIRQRGPPLVIASFGAGAILEYNTIESPLAQPRNSILGHAIATVIGIGVTKAFEASENFEALRWVAAGLACGLASAAMSLTKTIYPPAGATAILAAVDPTIHRLGWYLLPLVLLCSSLTLVISLLINNLHRRFPTYWWTPSTIPNPKCLEDVLEAPMMAQDSQHQLQRDTPGLFVLPPIVKHVTPSQSSLQQEKSAIVAVPVESSRLPADTSPASVTAPAPNAQNPASAPSSTHNTIIITEDQVIIPEGLSLAFEESNMLLILRNRLAQNPEDRLSTKADSVTPAPATTTTTPV